MNCGWPASASVDAANRYLRDVYLPQHNATFRRRAARSGQRVRAARRGRSRHDPVSARRARRSRPITPSWSAAACLQIERQPGRRTCAGLRVLVRQHLDGRHHGHPPPMCRWPTPWSPRETVAPGAATLAATRRRRRKTGLGRWPKPEEQLAEPLSEADRSRANQTAGFASFVVYEKGQRVGTVETNVTRTAEGWRIQSSMQTKGSVPVSIVNLDLLYDAKWFGRWMTMEMKQPDDVIVHVAVVRTTAQTDIVRSTRGAFPVEQCLAQHHPAPRACVWRLRGGRGPAVQRSGRRRPAAVRRARRRNAGDRR